MADRRRALLTVVMAVVVTAGCGVAETRRPVDLGDAAVAGSFGGVGVKEPAAPETATDPVNLVTLYLQAGIGDPERAAERLRKFFVPDSSWKPTPAQSVTIVRLMARPSRTLQGGAYLVTVQLQRIGTMSPTGAVEPAPDQRPTTERFTVVGQGTPVQWRLKAAPPSLMISDTTLETMYQPSPVYFWNLDHTRLVPDLRYVALDRPLAERLNQVVEWQVAAPSPWLRPAVVSFKAGVKLKERVGQSENGVVINLSSGAASDDPNELRRLTDQLRWTLRAHIDRPIELLIEGQPKTVDRSAAGYLAANAAAVDRAPALFGVGTEKEKEKVVPKKGLKAPPVLTHKANEQVSLAGISAEPYNVAAFVGGNRNRLKIVRIGTAERDQGKLSDADVPGLPTPIGRPVWIPEWDEQDRRDQFLVPAGGKLYLVDARGRSTLLPLSATGSVGSVSVSPDGRRVALAVGGRAYVGALAILRGAVTVGPELRELVAKRVVVAAVAWASESQVLVAGSTGTSGKAALFRVSSDGAVAVDASPSEAALIDVIAFPDRTGGSSGAGDIVAQTREAVFYVFSTTVQEAPDLVRPFYAG